MFDSLAEQMRHDEHEMVSNAERILRWAAVALLSILIFGGIFLGVHLLQ